MADVRLTVERMTKNGLAASYTGSLSISDTYLCRNTGRMFLHFKKSGAGDCDVTVETPITVAGLTVQENVVTVPASTGDVMIGPFPANIFNDGVGDVRFTVDEVTGLTVAVVEL